MPTDHFSLGLEDFKVNIRLKLSALWASVTLCYLYCDYFELYQAGKLESMLAGQFVGSIPATPGILLAASVILSISSLMIALSLLLPPRLCRISNVVFGVLFTLIMLAILPGVWPYYQFFAAVEIVITCYITWQAWHWPRLSPEVAR